MRMIDRIYQGRVMMPPWTSRCPEREKAAWAAKVIELCDHAPEWLAVVADDVTEHVCSLRPAPTLARLSPCVLPPRDRVFIETRAPKAWGSDFPVRGWALAITVDGPMVEGVLYLDRSAADKVIGPELAFRWQAAEDGSCVNVLEASHPTGMLAGEMFPPDAEGILLAPSFLAIGMLTVLGNPGETVHPSVKLNRKRVRAGRRPFLPHRVITLSETPELVLRTTEAP